MTTSVKPAKKLVEAILQDRQNANKIVDLISLLHLDQKDEILQIVLDGVCNFFSKAINNGELLKHKDASKDMMIYYEWIKSRYHESLSKILHLLDHESNATKEKCVITVLKLMESKIKISSEGDTSYFPETELESLVCAFIVKDVSTHMRTFCSTLWQLADLRYFTLRCITKCSAECLNNKELKSTMMQNIFSLLKLISECMPDDIDKDDAILTLAGNGIEILFSDTLEDDLTTDSTNSPKVLPKILDIKEQRKVFGNTWLEFMRYDMDSHLFKSVLIILQKSVIPNFASPCLLADFLTRSFNQGGGIALLSLHSLFVLMNEHNLEYPNFYTHLYSMIHPRIFDAKYQSRFFYLLNLFLSSTHLPAYLVAAFAKRLSRLTLVAPVCAQRLLVSFILTLIDRHPSIKVLINRNTKGPQKKTINTDPYLKSEADPSKCKAMESSLWELTVLSKHYLPSVVAAVKNIDSGPKQDVTDLLEDSYEEMFDKICDKKVTDTPMNYKSPTSLFGGFEDSVSELWAI